MEAVVILTLSSLKHTFEIFTLTLLPSCHPIFFGLMFETLFEWACQRKCACWKFSGFRQRLMLSFSLACIIVSS